MSVLTNDKEMLLTDLSCEVRKKFQAKKNDIPIFFFFFAVKLFLFKKKFAISES